MEKIEQKKDQCFQIGVQNEGACIQETTNCGVRKIEKKGMSKKKMLKYYPEMAELMTDNEDDSENDNDSEKNNNKKEKQGIC